MANENLLAAALGGGIGRRRTPGEMAGAGRKPFGAPSGEQRVSVDIPTGLYTQTKVLAAQSGTTVKKIMVDGLRAELERRHADQSSDGR